MNVFEVVKENVTARQAAEAYGLKVGRTGMACCPFHSDKSPSMKLDERYYCFGCGATGDAVDLTAKLFGIGLREAAVKLAEDFGLNYDSRQKPSVRPRIREPTPEQKYQKGENHCYKVLTDYFHLLREWEKKYAPKQPDEEWNPLFAEALHKKNYIEYLLDILLYGSLEERKADHQSKQYRLEDQLLKYFPQEIETNKGFIKGFEADLETLAAHPHPEDGFAGMEIRGDVLTDKENAGAALLDACKEVKGSEPVQIGSYRGFTMSVEFSAWKQEYTLLLKGQMTHRASLGTDPRGNLTRIDNALAQMPQRLEAVKNQLDNLYQQQAAAKEEIGKPFPFEDDLRVKSARLVELDTLLNIDGKGHAQPETVVAKSARPSVLDSLKRPVPPRSPEKKPKQHEEVR